MPVIDQIKHFIRHGKQAKQKGQYDIQGAANSVDKKADVNKETNNNDFPKDNDFNTATVVEQIVAEEREEKGKLPVYPGLERYQLIEKMGEGAFSNVYNAIDKATGQKVAIKIVRKRDFKESATHLHKDLKKKPKMTEQHANILKEVRIMRQLNHPSIISLYSFSESNDYYYLVLELMEGGELFNQIVKLTYFSENLSRHVIVQVAEGIRYLHEEKGIVHRDIKPENLLFTPIPITPFNVPPPPPIPGDEPKVPEGEFIPGVGGGGIGRVKIADFGLSKVVWDQHTKTPCGTVGYTAPEIVKDERYSKSVDIWALGCVLYTMLCGFPPFYDESIPVLSEKVAKGQYSFLSPWWDGISDAAKDLVSHLLEVDPSKRYTIKEFFEHPWVKNEPTQSSPRAPSTFNPLATPSSPLQIEEIMSPTTSNVLPFSNPPVLSPGVQQLKDAFDVCYTVHRIEEERARKKMLRKAQPKDLRQQILARNLGNMNDLDNDEEEEVDNYERENTEKGLSSKFSDDEDSDTDYMDTSDDNYVQNEEGSSSANLTDFGLNLDGATLLGRRRREIEVRG
ncbi:11134_t:CDS:2 [Paraglomus brasilianum]|uniref:11134_t:CDS:1 n=1 Tax=Paraglomus brasilianum TaxID=144538 RepID=A0A9N9AHH9_9GLOM|nr:11134_t:CDS:2 [Paraglomus brasilianum]